MVIRPRAVVFDCDGTIADTETLSDRAWTDTLAEHGYTPAPDDFRNVIGHPFAQNWAYFSARADLGDVTTFRARLRARFHALFDEELVIYDDAVDTIRMLADDDVALAVASSSSHAHVERVLERGGVTGLVSTIIGADDVTRHKPDPAPYLAALDGLGVDACAASAVEDTPVGVAAAVAAGAFTVGIVRTHASAQQLAAADRVVERITLRALDHPDDRCA